MKRFMCTMIVLALALGMAPMGLAERGSGKALVVYFSHTGTTEAVARLVAEATGADLVKLEAAEPYPDDQDALSARAEQERNDGILPALTTVIDDMAQYDTVYIGYPIWQGDFPQVIASFLSDYDLSGKRIAPFCTCGGTGLGETGPRIAGMQPGACVLDGLSVTAADVPKAKGIVTDWVRELTR